jgi:hypothetical protein
MMSKSSVSVLHNFVSDFKPDVRVFGGDLWDFRALRKGASEDEKRESMSKDYNAGLEFIKRYKPDYFLRGNHDERLWELAESDRGVISDYAMSGVVEIGDVLKKMGCKMLPYHKRAGVLRIGSLKMLHGFACGIYAARTTALVYGSCLFGHVHTVDQHSIAGLDRRVARAVGALCSLDMDYSARTPSTLRQANGFAFGVVHKKSGHYFVNQAERIDGKWLIPTEFKEYE